MRTIKLDKFGPIISDKDIGQKIYSLVKEALDKEEVVIIDLEEVISMATFCAKQIFGILYIELGSEVFFNKIKIKNANSDIKMIINMGINSALDEV